MASEPLLHDITDTARWVAVLRAIESDRPDAVFHDPYAWSGWPWIWLTDRPDRRWSSG